jgi:hypothetical protein
MATLFFEGFDKGIIFNQLDPNYWSTEFKRFPKYSFGGYAPVFDGGASYNLSYSSTSPNNGILASGVYVQDGNRYPGFGTPPGFLALSNIEVENSSTQEYPTYLQASGFPVSTGDITYFSMRCLGLESKHVSYSNYPHRHQLLSFNSGNSVQLAINVVKITGNNNLLLINNKRETLALEVVQNDQTLGYFDLNISNILSRYKISSIGSNNHVLSITDSNLNAPGGIAGPTPISRWSHIEFSIDQSTENPELYINVEDINLQVIDSDVEKERVEWINSIPISGFNFNNIRFYNRTYSSSVISGHLVDFYGYPITDEQTIRNYYYMVGKVWLLDDIALIDNTNPEPSYWLGASSRVIQIVPGVSYSFGQYGQNKGSLADNGGKSDGLLEWSTNTSVPNYSFPNNHVPSHRRSLSFLDNDNGIIETINSGNIDAVSFSTIIGDAMNDGSIYRFIETASSWRLSFNEAIGGIKVYNSARKKYLDTKFINVFRSGVSDINENSVSILLKGDISPVIDSSLPSKTIYTTDSLSLSSSVVKFDQSSLYFPNSTSYLYLSHPDIGNNPITIESWVYFNNSGNKIAFFDKTKSANNILNNGVSTYSFDLDISGITYNNSNLGTITKLFFPTTASIDTWHHVALVKDSSNRLICYLNGQSGVDYTTYDNPNNNIVENDIAFNYGVFSGNYNYYYGVGSFTNKLYTLDTTDITSQSSNSGPITSCYLTIGKAGYLDNYRISSSFNRYPTNFDVPQTAFKSKKEDYVELGPQFTVDKTLYKTYQYYSLQNPATQQNWQLSEITGIIFGVKKL